MATSSFGRSRGGERGSALVFALVLILVIMLIGAAVLRVTGADRIAAGKLGIRERAQACAEAGIQYGRRLYGMNYTTTHGWNDLLDGTTSGYIYDPRTTQGSVALAAAAPETLGRIDGAAGGNPDFWVSIRDDDDELPSGLTANVPTRDNNEVVILRSTCINSFLQVEEGNEVNSVVVEVLLAHVQGGSGYGNAQITSNSPDIVGTRP